MILHIISAGAIGNDSGIFGADLSHFLTEVECDGTESTLRDCSSANFPIGNRCMKDAGAEVICLGKATILNKENSTFFCTLITDM